VADVVTAAGPGGGPHVKVFDGRTGALLGSFFAYDPTFTGGVNVAVGDVTGDGKPDIVTAPGAGGAPQVRVFDTTGHLVTSFLAYDASFLGGVNVAVGDVNGDRTCDIVTAAGAGGGPHVKVFAGSASGLGSNVLASFIAYDPTFTGGVSVTTGDFDGDGLSEIITGAEAGGGPHVEVFSGLGTSVRASFFAFATTFSGGVRVAATDVDNDGHDDLIADTGTGTASDAHVFDGTKFTPLSDVPAFPGFNGGTFVGGTTVHPIAAANEDAVLAWNSIALSAIATDKTAPPQASRALAMVQTAIFNAVNAPGVCRCGGAAMGRRDAVGNEFRRSIRPHDPAAGLDERRLHASLQPGEGHRQCEQHDPHCRPDPDRPILGRRRRHLHAAWALERDRRVGVTAAGLQPGPKRLAPGGAGFRDGRRRHCVVGYEVLGQFLAPGHRHPGRGHGRQPADRCRPELDAVDHNAGVPGDHFGAQYL
jgi:hypothetical protein